MLTSEQHNNAIEWQLPTSSLSLKRGEVHIWKVRYSHQEIVYRCLPLLSDDEQKRATRLVVKAVRTRFICARAAVRMILSLYTRQNPGEIRFHYGVLGKPMLAPNSNYAVLQFNMSHSGDLILAAVTLGNELGVDLERNTVVNGKQNILKMLFSKKDQNNYNQLPEQYSDDAFINGWTCKEAWGKAHGNGLAQSSEIDFIHSGLDQLDAPHLPCLTLHADYWLLRMQPASGYCAAVVCLSNVNPRLHFYQTSIQQLLRCRPFLPANFLD